MSRTLVAELLNAAGYSLQAQDQGGRQPPRAGCAIRPHQHPSGHRLSEQQPVISVDTKKKELVGDFRNNGREYRPQGRPEEVRVHDSDQGARPGSALRSL
ncbi:MAG: hypothetical protein JO121_00610 [Deltaproteobacteria bacterium]|nr:hypothetical protein [Deltaproteobacteria bacterium]